MAVWILLVRQLVLLVLLIESLLDSVLSVDLKTAEAKVKNSLVVELHGELFLDPHFLHFNGVLDHCFEGFFLQREEPEDRGLVSVLSSLLEVLSTHLDIVQPPSLQEELLHL